MTAGIPMVALDAGVKPFLLNTIPACSFRDDKVA